MGIPGHACLSCRIYATKFQLLKNSTAFGDGLETVKPQPVTSNLSLLMSHYQ